GLSSTPAPGTDKTIGCTKHPTISTIPNWSLGSTTLPPARLPTQSLGFGKVKIRGRPVGGLLGADAQALSGRVRIDYGTGSVTFRAAAPSGGTAVKLRELHHGAGTALIAPVTVHGRRLSMLVDTGASRTTLQASVADTLGLPKVGKPVTVNAAGCPASVQPVRLSGASIGGRALPTMVIDTAAAGTPY